MEFGDIATRGMVLLGCGKMGGAMLAGWLQNGLSPDAVYVIDPKPSEWLTATGVHVNEALPEAPAMTLLAVKPQMMGDALPAVAALSGRTVFLSIAAGTTIAMLRTALGPDAAIIRAMPNTPAAVGRGITALIGDGHAEAADLNLAEALLSAVGQVVRLENEAQMDAVTAVSGSGPAYVFHLIECLARAGEAEGLSPDLAMTLAKATVGGAGVLAEEADETPRQLRINVTSPNGTTQAALEELMDEAAGLPPLMARAVAAAAKRSRELGK